MKPARTSVQRSARSTLVLLLPLLLLTVAAVTAACVDDDGCKTGSSCTPVADAGAGG
jgi:hypothetical protein